MNRTSCIPAVLMIAITTTSSALAKEKQTLQLSPKNMEFFYAKGQEEECKGKKALHLIMTKEKPDGGGAFFKDIELADGVIEVDIAAARFAGLAFRGKDGDHYEKLYFRPFNSKTKKHENTVQYASAGVKGGTWNALRKKFPGKYEAGADIAKMKWFRAKLVVAGEQVKVFVNDGEKPVLVVEKMLGARKDGKIGIWAWDAYYANFSYKKGLCTTTQPTTSATKPATCSK